MLALRVNRKSLDLKKIPRPRKRQEALVRVVLSGICNTDLEIARGYAGFNGTIGHEFVGIVEQSPDDKLLGRRVVGEINAGCGKCVLCLAGDPRHCPRRTVLGIVGRDGAHAEFLQLPVENLIPVPARVSDHHAVFTEPLAAACAILELAAVSDSNEIAVIGDGKLGLLCAQVAAADGGAVLVVGKHKEKLQIVERRGIETARPKDAAKLKGRFDVVVEASGSATGFALALDLVRPRGQIILKSTFHGATEINAARVVVDEISIVGSRCGRFGPALDLLERNAVDVESLISEEHELASGLTAMTRAAAKGVLKVLLRPAPVV